jgi:hypothetical protein
VSEEEEGEEEEEEEGLFRANAVNEEEEDCFLRVRTQYRGIIQACLVW